MAYPNVPSTYGFKPVNLIGGQVFSGSTRQIPIQYGFGTNIFYGDIVVFHVALSHAPQLPQVLALLLAQQQVVL